MIFINQHRVLIEIKTLANGKFLILDQNFDFVPQNILNSAKSTTNWNRAFKIETIQIDQDCISNYFMVEFDIYFDFNQEKFILMSKNNFFQHLLNNDYIYQFLKPIFHFKNRHQIPFVNKHFSNDEFWKYNLEVVDDYDNFIYHKAFIKNLDYLSKTNKFKMIFTQGNEFKIIQTKLHQIIYQLNQKDLVKIDPILAKVDFFEFNKGRFIITSLIGSNELNLNTIFEFYHLELANEIKIFILDQINNSNIENKEWHQFNITSDINYIWTWLNEFNSFEILIEELNKVFSTLEINFYQELFNHEKIAIFFEQLAIKSQNIELFLTMKKRY